MKKSKDDDKKEEDPMKALLRKHVKNPHSVAFVDMADSRISAEQRLLELKIEKLDEQCRELRQRRIHFWATPFTAPDIALPEQHLYLDLLDLRRQRLSANAEAGAPQKPFEVTHPSQLLSEELDVVGQRKNCIEVVGPMLIEFCDRHAHRMALRRYAYLRRVAVHCKGTEEVEVIDPLLKTYLEATDREHAMAVEFAQKIRRNLPVALKASEDRESESKAESAGGGAGGSSKDGESRPSTSMSKPGAVVSGSAQPGEVLGRTTVESLVADREPLPKAALRLFLRWVTAQVRMHKRLSRFLSKVQWLIYSQRFDLLKRSKALLVNPALQAAQGATSAAQAAAVASATSSGGGPGSGKMPTMVVSVERLNTVLAGMRQHFGIEAEIEADNCQQFAFATKIILASLHALQSADTSYPPYDSTVVGRFMPVPVTGVRGGASLDVKGRRGSNVVVTDKAMIETTYLKPASWLQDKVFAPRESHHKHAQAALLAKSIKEVDHILQGEADAILEDDLDKVNKRVTEQVSGHMDRANTVNDASGGGKGTLTSAGLAPPLPIERLTPMYQLRLLQIRQSRRRLMGVLNFFRSVERRLTLNAKGFAFPSHPGEERHDAKDATASAKKQADTASASELPRASSGGQNSTAGEQGNLVGAAGSRRHEVHAARATDFVTDPNDVMKFQGIMNRDDSYAVDAQDIVRVRDAANVQILYDVTLEDMKELESEMLHIGTHFLQSYQERFVSDRASMLEDLYASEAAFYEALKLLVDVFLESYDHTTDKGSQDRIAQTITDIMARRPNLDFGLQYFTESYSAEVVAVHMEASLLREVLVSQMGEERMYRNSIAARNHAVAIAERFGFPPELHQAITHESLLGGLGQIMPCPGAVPVGILDLYESLDSLAGVVDVYNSVVEELAYTFNLKSNSAITAIKTVVLQQALVEWRLLLEEADLTEELSKNTGEIGQRPYANNFLVDDPFAVEKVIEDLQRQLEFEAEDAEKRRAKTAKDKKRGGGASAGAEGKLIAEEEARHPNPMIQSHLNAIEAVLTRKGLLECIYDTDILQHSYRVQAGHYGRDVAARQMPPIDFGNMDIEQQGRTKPKSAEEVSCLGADFVTHIAMAEFDVPLASFDFQTLEGLKEAFASDRLHALRQALRLQVLERGLVSIALQYNQPCLDRCMEAVLLKEESLYGVFAHGNVLGGPRAAGAGAGKKTDAAADAEKKKRIENDVRRFMQEETNKIRDHFLVLSALKQTRRQQLHERFIQKAGSISGSGPAAKRQVRVLKYELLEQYMDLLLQDVEVQSVKSQIARMSGLLARQACTLPKPKLLFQQTVDPQASEVSQARPLEFNDDSGRDLSIFSNDLALVNLWRLPHPIEVVEELAKEPRTLRQYLQCLASLHNIIVFYSAYARTMPQPLVTSKDRSFGLDFVQQMLTQTKLHLDALPDSSQTHEVAKFLQQSQRVALAKYLLTLNAATLKLLSEPSPNYAHVRLLRAAYKEATAPQFPPVAQFPASLPEAPAVVALRRRMPSRGPNPESPTPEPYRGLGLMLVSLPEAERTTLMNEWQRLDGLLQELMTLKSTFMATSPLAAQANCEGFLATSLELDNMKGRLGELLVGIRFPSVHAEFQQWNQVYEQHAVSRMRKAKEKADHEYSEHQAALLSSEADPSSSAQRAGEKAAQEFEALSTEFSQRTFIVRVLHDECCKLQLHDALDKATKAHSKALANIDTLEVGGKGGEEDKGRAMVGVTGKGKEDIAKEDILLEFLHAVREASAEQSDAAGQTTLVLEKGRFHEAVDMLACRLRGWGEVQMELELQGMRTQNTNLVHLLYLQERNMQYKDAVREREQQSMDRRIDVAVKDQCYRLLFRIDALERQLEASHKELNEMERTVRERLKVEFEDLVKDLGTQLTMVRSQFKEYRESLQQDMKSNLNEIRQDAMRKIMKTNNAPIELKRMTLKMAHTEDTIEDLTIENSELKRALLKVRTMNSVKDLSIRMSYDKRLKAMQAEKLETSKDLYVEKAENQKQMEILDTRLKETNEALAAAEGERDKLRKELDLAIRNKQSLLTWKVAKSQLMAELESRVKKYEKWSHVDVDKLMIELEKKEAELKHLQALDPGELQRHRSLMDASAKREVEKLRRQLAAEQRLKLEAFQKLDALRNDFKWEEYFEATDDKQSMVGYWRRRFTECNSQLQGTLEENERLLEAMTAAGLDLPPEVKASRDKASSAAPAGAQQPPPTLAAASSFRPQSAPVPHQRPLSSRVLKMRPASGAVPSSSDRDHLASLLSQTAKNDEQHSALPSRPAAGSGAAAAEAVRGSGSRPGTGSGRPGTAGTGGRPPTAGSNKGAPAARAAGGGGFYVRRPGTGKLGYYS